MLCLTFFVGTAREPCVPRTQGSPVSSRWVAVVCGRLRVAGAGAANTRSDSAGKQSYQPHVSVHGLVGHVWLLAWEHNFMPPPQRDTPPRHAHPQPQAAPHSLANRCDQQRPHAVGLGMLRRLLPARSKTSHALSGRHIGQQQPPTGHAYALWMTRNQTGPSFMCATPPTPILPPSLTMHPVP
jgi:hypothetical protein